MSARLLALLFMQVALAGTPCDDVVCVEVEQSKEAVRFYANSRADGVTISFSVTGLNIEPSSPPILTRGLKRGRTELMTLKTIAGKKPTFDHGFFWEWGVVGATHDEKVSYRLPFESGKSFRLFQGPHGVLSHQGQFAYDFPMPLGTPVCAARAGTVGEVVDEFEEGGPDPKFRNLVNRILIVHDDGTIAAYMHFQRGGMRVKTGDRVEAGTIIGLAGNSGQSTGPHLHFEVFRRVDEVRRETLPVKFTTGKESGVVLEEGKSYRAE